MQTWTTRRIILVALTAGAILYLVFYAPQAVMDFIARIWDVLVIMTLATALAFLLSAPVDLLSRIPGPLSVRSKRAVATLVVMVALVWLAWTITSATADQIIQELRRITTIARSWMLAAPENLQHWIDAYAKDLPPGLVDTLGDAVTRWTRDLVEYQFTFAKGALLQGWYLVELLIIPVVAFYLLVDSRPLRDGLVYMVPSQYATFANSVLDDISLVLHSYVRAQVLLCVVQGLLVGVLLWLCGVKMYLTLAAITLICRLAPVIGPVIAGMLVVGIPALQQGPHLGMIVFGFYLGFNVLDGKVLTPLLLSGSAMMHPVIVILSLLLGYEFMGILGLLIAVPIAATVRAVYLRYHATFHQPPPDPAAETEPDGAPYQMPEE